MFVVISSDEQDAGQISSVAGSLIRRRREETDPSIDPKVLKSLIGTTRATTPRPTRPEPIPSTVTPTANQEQDIGIDPESIKALVG